MRNKDVLFTSNNPTVEAAKAMQFFRLTVATVNDPINAAVNVYALKAAINGNPPSIVTTIQRQCPLTLKCLGANMAPVLRILDYGSAALFS